MNFMISFTYDDLQNMGTYCFAKAKYLIHKSLYEAKDDYFSQESQSDGALERRIEFNRVKTLKVNS